MVGEPREEESIVNVNLLPLVAVRRRKRLLKYQFNECFMAIPSIPINKSFACCSINVDGPLASLLYYIHPVDTHFEEKQVPRS